MMRSLFTKTLYDKRWFIAGWSFTLFILGILIMAFYPSIKDTNAFEQLAGSVPDQFKGFVGDPSSFASITNYVAVQLYQLQAPLFIMIMTLVLAQNLTVSQEEKGTLRTLLGTPLSRSRIVMEHWLAGCVIAVVVVIFTMIGALAGLASVGESVGFDLILKLNLMLLLLAITAFSIPYAIGYATGKRVPTMIAGIFVVGGSYLLSTFSASVEWLKNWDVISLLHYYDVKALTEGEFNRGGIWTLLLLTVLAILVAVLFFRRRDVE